MKKIIHQFKIFFRQGLRADWADKEKLLTPFFFSASLLILFVFAGGEQVSQESRSTLFLAEALLTLFFTLQTIYLRIFSAEEDDGVFTLALTYPVSQQAVFLSKICLSTLWGTCVTLPSLLLNYLFHGIDFGFAVLFGISFLVLLSLGSLGVLLSALTLRASGREVLFPILYFLLSSPVLLAASQALLAYLTDEPSMLRWVGLLGACDLIYLSLGLILFDEIFEQSSS
ncbi:MAG: heme exporter protein CcmB [Oligoflexales bacterium]|nr:heme exporter protein CcmB [Oligoflexales bacterium]